MENTVLEFQSPDYIDWHYCAFAFLWSGFGIIKPIKQLVSNLNNPTS